MRKYIFTLGIILSSIYGKMHTIFTILSFVILTTLPASMAMAAYCSFTRNPTSCSPIYTGSNCKTGEYVRADS
ncbi:MAG: hypothetical protein KBS86_01385, partial [Proteobacteria bacterium]|nr:hypothetical protein [Candidatus Enterousia scatequi]